MPMTAAECKPIIILMRVAQSNASNHHSHTAIIKRLYHLYSQFEFMHLSSFLGGFLSFNCVLAFFRQIILLNFIWLRKRARRNPGSRLARVLRSFAMNRTTKHHQSTSITCHQGNTRKFLFLNNMQLLHKFAEREWQGSDKAKKEEP